MKHKERLHARRRMRRDDVCRLCQNWGPAFPLQNKSGKFWPVGCSAPRRHTTTHRPVIERLYVEAEHENSENFVCCKQNKLERSSFISFHITMQTQLLFAHLLLLLRCRSNSVHGPEKWGPRRSISCRSRAVSCPNVVRK